MGNKNNNTEVEEMSAIRRAMYDAQDPEVRNKIRREMYGSEIDDYLRRLTGKESYYDEQARKENEEYWADYLKNTGVEPRYPIRVGSEWNQPIDVLPMTMNTGRRAINMLYGGQH